MLGHNLLTVALFFLFYVALGQLTLRYLWQNSSLLSPKLQMIAAFYLGIGFWYAVATALGLLGYFTWQIVLIIAVVVLLAATKSLVKLLSESFRIIKAETFSLRQTSWLWRILLASAFLLLFAGLGGIGNTALEDGAAFYLPIAKMMAYSGWLEKLPGYEGFSAVGLIGELQMASVFLFNAEEAGRLFSWFCFTPMFLLMFDFAKKLKLSSQATIILLICVFSSSAIFFITGGGKIDLFGAAFGLIGLYLLFFEKEHWVASILLGLACVAKLSLLIPFFPIILMGLAYQSLQQSKTSFFKAFIFKNVTLGSIVFLTLIPHLIKNYVFFANPLAPFYGSSFGWETTWYTLQTTQRIILTYPLVWFYGSYWAQLGVLSLPILMFLPFYFSRKSFDVKNWLAQDYFLASLFTGMIFWLCIRPSFVAPRYILAVLLSFAPFAAAGFDRWKNRNIIFPKKLMFATILMIVWSMHSLERMQRYGASLIRSYYYVSGQWPYCARDAYHCYIVDVLNKVVPPGQRILQLTYFTYWLRGDLLQTMRQTEEFKFPPAPLKEEIWKMFYEHDFNYVYLDRVSHDASIKTHSIDQLPSWVRLEKIAEFETVSAYKIIYADSVKFRKKRKVVQDGLHWKVENIL
ncbi:MAG: hypothetical protein H7328_01770 [Bdellovibrio sp.]|nr:hypothetical protein [Bdellovibrio sp.]